MKKLLLKTISAILIITLLFACGAQAFAENTPANADEIVWVKDTETELDVKTGELTRWQHACELDSEGRIALDYAVAQDNDSKFKFTRHKYDAHGNQIWEDTIEISDNLARGASGELFTYDDSNNNIQAITMGSDAAVTSDNKELLKQFESEYWEGLPEQERERGELFKQYAFEDTVSFLDKEILIYSFPINSVFQSEYNSSGKCVRSQSISMNPAFDFELIFSYENTSDGSVQTGYCYRNSELISRRIVHFDPAGREISLEIVDMNGNTNSWRETTYDENGNIIERINGIRGTESRVDRYEYDSYGNVISEKKYDYSWNEDIPYETHEYTYIARIR